MCWMACHVTFASASAADQRASSHRSKAFISLVQVSATSAGRPGRPAIIERTRQSVVNSAWSMHLTRTTRWLTRCLSVRFREIMMRCVMRRKIGAAIAALLLLSGSSLMSFAQPGGSPSAGQKGVAGSPKAEGIGSTSSTHNPSGSSSSTTGMENRTGIGSDMGTNTSTHNPAGKKD